MRSAFAVLGLTAILAVGVSFAQVHIQEKAVINPVQPREVQEGGNVNNHNVRFEFYWDTPLEGGVDYFALYPCLDSVYGYSGPCQNSAIVNLSSLPAGNYWFEPHIWFGSSGPTTHWYYRLYEDGALEDSASGSSVYIDEFYFYVNYSTSYESKFYLYFGKIHSSFPEFTYGGSISPMLTGYDDCTATSWSSGSDAVTLSIISGGQYASFHTIDSDGNDVKLGLVATTTGDASVAGAVSLVADGVQPDSAGDWITVEAKSNGLTDIDSVQLFPSPIVVNVIPSEISPGDTANIVVLQRNPDGAMTDFPDYQQFEVGIDSGMGKGTILWNNDTSSYFINIQQPFQFIAADSIGADSVVAGIRVGVNTTSIASSTRKGSNGPSRQTPSAVKPQLSGNVPAHVSKGTLAKGGKSVLSTNNFVDNDEWGVGYVTIKQEGEILISVSVDPSEVRPLNTGGNSRTTVTVLATEEGKPVSGIPVQLSAKGVEGTGGHDHDGSRPAGTFSVSSGATDDDGKFVSTYTASEFGGIERIIATAAGVTDSVADTVKVDGLIELAGGTSYELVGTPDSYKNTNDLCRESTPTSLHYSNHYSAPALVSAVRNIATSYNLLHPGVKLRINDMSLVWGGLFDIDNHWKAPHAEHRVGINADIGFTGINGDGQCCSLNKRDLLGQVSKYTNGTRHLEGDHYHITER
jgi:hypothetical protein